MDIGKGIIYYVTFTYAEMFLMVTLLITNFCKLYKGLIHVIETWLEVIP
jgi:hypothetical protein